ncbi:MAG: hypothetical protein OXU20_35100 [Myxococcales bacterium]|nr:hypothetical protein [Myxococcales bacterium]
MRIRRTDRSSDGRTDLPTGTVSYRMAFGERGGLVYRAKVELKAGTWTASSLAQQVVHAR